MFEGTSKERQTPGSLWAIGTTSVERRSEPYKEKDKIYRVEYGEVPW